MDIHRLPVTGPTSIASPELRGSGAIYAVLRREIAHLRLRPGERLSENELAERFGTSRMPVREALIRLVDDGLIQVLPQRGSFVSKISLAAMRQARFVREALEQAVVRQAARDGLPESAVERCELAIRNQVNTAQEPENFIVQDDLFHRAIAEGVGLDGVWAIIEREKVQFDRVRILSLPSATPVSVLIGQHQAILDAILARDVGSAVAAMGHHLQEVLAIADNLLQQHAELIQD